MWYTIQNAILCIVCDIPQPDPVEGTLTDWQAMAPDPDVKAVVVGFDPFFSYMKMMKAASYITKQGCPFVATNLDPALPLKEGCQILVPGKS